MTKREPPTWDTGDPSAEGIYLGFSDDVDRKDEADIYFWVEGRWRHHLGLYDNLVSHWIFIKGLD